MVTQRDQCEVNPKAVNAISRFSTWTLVGTCAALVLIVSQYNWLCTFVAWDVVILSLLLMLFSLVFGVAHKVSVLRFDRQSNDLSQNTETLERFIHIQILLILFQSALLASVVLLFGCDLAITAFVN